MLTMDNPLISLIIVTYNSAALRNAGAAGGLAAAGRLRRALFSLLGRYGSVLARLAARLAGVGRFRGLCVSRARRQRQEPALGLRANQEQPADLPENHALA